MQGYCLVLAGIVPLRQSKLVLMALRSRNHETDILYKTIRFGVSYGWYYLSLY